MKESTEFKRSPLLFRPIEKWYDYYNKMNDEQLHLIELRLDRLHRICQQVERARQAQYVQTWELYNR
jgi:3-dehydroquinate dehydratase